MDVDVVVVVDLDGDGGVDLVGGGIDRRVESAKHDKIARGEAMECAASLDVLRLRKLVGLDRYDRGIQLLEGVVAMLTKML